VGEAGDRGFRSPGGRLAPPFKGLLVNFGADLLKKSDIVYWQVGLGVPYHQIQVASDAMMVYEHTTSSVIIIWYFLRFIKIA
jgi:hypothetical protein